MGRRALVSVEVEAFAAVALVLLALVRRQAAQKELVQLVSCQAGHRALHAQF